MKSGYNISIWDFLHKLPAGTMFVPLIISSIITTICLHCGLNQSLWDYLGSPTKDLFGSSGIMFSTGLMLFVTGTMLKINDFVKMAQRGLWVTLIRLIPAYVFCFLIYYFCGLNGFSGLNFVLLVSLLVCINASMYVAVVEPYADTIDKALLPLLCLTSVPLLPFIFISSFGEGESNLLSKILQIISLLLPFLLGFILGNLDSKIRTIFKDGNTILLPFIGFQFGSNIDLVQAFNINVLLSGLLALLIFYFFNLLPFLFERFILKRTPYISTASSSLAGLGLAVPNMFITYTFNGESFSNLLTQSLAILAFVLLMSNMLAPLFTSLTIKLGAKYDNKIFLKTFKDNKEILEKYNKK